MDLDDKLNASQPQGSAAGAGSASESSGFIPMNLIDELWAEGEDSVVAQEKVSMARLFDEETENAVTPISAAEQAFEVPLETSVPKESVGYRSVSDFEQEFKDYNSEEADDAASVDVLERDASSKYAVIMDMTSDDADDVSDDFDLVHEAGTVSDDFGTGHADAVSEAQNIGSGFVVDVAEAQPTETEFVVDVAEAQPTETEFAAVVETQPLEAEFTTQEFAAQDSVGTDSSNFVVAGIPAIDISTDDTTTDSTVKDVAMKFDEPEVEPKAEVNLDGSKAEPSVLSPDITAEFPAVSATVATATAATAQATTAATAAAQTAVAPVYTSDVVTPAASAAVVSDFAAPASDTAVQAVAAVPVVLEESSYNAMYGTSSTESSPVPNAITEEAAAEAKEIEERKLALAREQMGMSGDAEDAQPEEVEEEPVEQGISVITREATVLGDIITQGHIDIVGRVKGNIDAKGDVAIHGIVRGDVGGSKIGLYDCRVKGNLDAALGVIVDESSIIGGDVKTKNIIFDGKVKGNIDAENVVVLRSHSLTLGDVSAASLAVEPGAILNGNVRTLVEGDLEAPFEEVL